jgi:cell division initiation protein
MEKFSSVFRGYNKDEVNDFVDEMTVAYSNMLDKLKEKDKEIETLKLKLDSKYNDSNDDAQQIISNAKDYASRILNDALVESKRLKSENLKVKESIKIYKDKVKKVLESELESLDINN